MGGLHSFLKINIDFSPIHVLVDAICVKVGQEGKTGEICGLHQ